MPILKTKEELIIAGNENFKKLFDLINSMIEEEQNKTFTFVDRDRNVRDILIHLYEWHQLLINLDSFKRKVYGHKIAPSRLVIT